MLKRDSDGRFGLLLKEDERGIFIATLLETDVSDERAVLRVGDHLRALNGDLVRATEQEAEQAAAGEPNAQRPTSAPTLQAAGTPASAPLSLDDAKQLVRALTRASLSSVSAGGAPCSGAAARVQGSSDGRRTKGT